MASQTLLQMRTLVRDDVWDNAATTTLTDAQVTSEINRAMYLYAALMRDDIQLLVASATAAITVGNKSTSVTASSTVAAREFVYAENGVDGIPMKHESLAEIKRLQSDEPSQGAPTKWCVIGNASQNSFTLYTHPIPDGSYTINLWTTVQPAVLSADGQKSVFGDHESYTIARMASIECAAKLGRMNIPNFIENLTATLPQRIQEHYAVMSRQARPLAQEGRGLA